MNWLIVLAVATLLSITATAQESEIKEDPTFPKKDEILLVVGQAERALDQYKRSVDLEATLPSEKNAGNSLSTDRNVIEMTAKLLSDLKQNPEAFHGLGGLLLLSSLDDGSRNAALCSSSAMGDSVQSILAKPDVAAATQMLSVGNACTDASAHLFTVSESVQALLVREMKAQQLLNQRVKTMLDKCAVAMRQATPARKNH